jgi:Ser/Thr protein kinase RdoA (MazF antagonist)
MDSPDVSKNGGQLDLVLAMYSFPHVRTVQPIAASKRNDNFLIEDGRGRRYVLRRYRRNQDPARIDFQLRFQEHLLIDGFPTSEIVRTPSGALSLTQGADNWALFTYLEGPAYDFNRPLQAVEAGRCLAQFHELAESFDGPEVTVPHNGDIRRWLEREPVELHRLERMFIGQDVSNELHFLRTWHDTLVRDFPLRKPAPRVLRWMHGDYHARNMVFSGDKVLGVFDFDAVHRGFRVEDLGGTAFSFGREFRGSFRLRPDIVRLFIEAYEKTSGRLEQIEREALPLMVVGVPLDADYYEMLRRDGEDPALYLRENIRTMKALYGQVEHFRAVFGT